MTTTLTILGCGSSGGVPRVGQGWGLCDPNNPKNRRLRCSVLVQRRSSAGVTSVLVDTSPDLRQQLLTAEADRLDAVLYTHEHADHTHGIDDLRGLALAMRRRVDIYADAATSAMLYARFGYCFASPPGSEYPPILNAHLLKALAPIEVSGEGGAITTLPIPVRHGAVEIFGLRFGNCLYTPDINGVAEEHAHHFEKLDIWVIDALREKPHPSHFSLADSLAWIDRFRPKRAVLTNLHNDMDYAALRAKLPSHIEPAYDGMILSL